MYQTYRLLHIIGLVLWFGALAGDLFLVPAARKQELRVRAWALGVYAKSMWIEVVGSALLLASGIGLLVEFSWAPWEFTWLLVKLIAVVVVMTDRFFVFFAVRHYFLGAAAASDEDLESRVAAGTGWHDRHAKVFGPFGVIGLVAIFWMVLWKPGF